MAPTEKFEELTLADLSLEPLPDPNLMQYEPPKTAAAAEKAKFLADSRNKQTADRRVNGERRKELRFEADRRSGKERRPKKSWEPGKNI